MKFRCRPKSVKFVDNINQLKQWHKKFAWFPVRVCKETHTFVWLQFYYRRLKVCPPSWINQDPWEHRDEINTQEERGYKWEIRESDKDLVFEKLQK